MTVQSLGGPVFNVVNAIKPALTQPELLALCKGGDEAKLCEAMPDNSQINIDCSDSDSNTPLIHICRKGWKEALALFMQAKGIHETINDRNRRTGRTAFSVACNTGQYEIAAKLLTVEGVDVNPQDMDGLTPLFVATHRQDEDALNILLKDKRILVNQTLPQNAVVEDVKIGGVTPLIFAAAQGLLKSVRMLIKAPGIDLDYIGPRGFTALAAAEYAGHGEIAKMLREAEAKNVNLLTWGVGWGRYLVDKMWLKG